MPVNDLPRIGSGTSGSGGKFQVWNQSVSSSGAVRVTSRKVVSTSCILSTGHIS